MSLPEGWQSIHVGRLRVAIPPRDPPIYLDGEEEIDGLEWHREVMRLWCDGQGVDDVCGDTPGGRALAGLIRAVLLYMWTDPASVMGAMIHALRRVREGGR